MIMTNPFYKDKQNLNVASMQARMKNLIPISAPSLPVIRPQSVPVDPSRGVPSLGRPVGTFSRPLPIQQVYGLPSVETSVALPPPRYSMGRSGGAGATLTAPPLSSFGSGPIQNLITKKANSYGVDPAVALGVAKAESSFNPNAKNKSSSAGGVFQLIDSTWEKYGGKGNRFDPEKNVDAGLRMLRDNQRYLVGRGITPTPEAVYLSQFLGPNGAVRILSNPKDDVSKHLSKNAIKVNDLYGKTGYDMLSWARGKMGLSGPTGYAGP